MRSGRGGGGMACSLCLAVWCDNSEARDRCTLVLRYFAEAIPSLQ